MMKHFGSVISRYLHGKGRLAERAPSSVWSLAGHPQSFAASQAAMHRPLTRRVRSPLISVASFPTLNTITDANTSGSPSV
jgi:hypothetical protein